MDDDGGQMNFKVLRFAFHTRLTISQTAQSCPFATLVSTWKCTMANEAMWFRQRSH